MQAVSLERVAGPQLILRLITPDDAAYVHALRTDPLYNQYLSTICGAVDDQRRWIEAYKLREAEGREFYYVIERKDGLRCGLVRLYDITSETFTWGSWILDANKPSKGALESAFLSFGLGFDRLRCDRALVDVRVQNRHAIAFYRRFGMVEIDRTKQDIYFVYDRRRFETDRISLSAILLSKGN